MNNSSLYRPYKAEPSFSGLGLSSGLLSFNVTLFIPAGIGVSVISNRDEEIIYLLFRGVKMHLLKQDNNYQFNTHVDCVQVIFNFFLIIKYKFIFLGR